MSGCTIVIGDWNTMRDPAMAIRYAVFVEEQRIPAALEWDEHDAASWHGVACDNGLPVATGRLLPDGHIGRMAVLKASRGFGIGGLILEGLMAKAAELGFAELILHAQLTAIPFYARYGFVAEGEQFMEAGIPHRLMRKSPRT